MCENPLCNQKDLGVPRISFLILKGSKKTEVVSVIDNRYLSKFVGAQRRREMHIYWQIYDCQQNEQHLLFPFVLSLSSLLLPTTSFFGSLSLFPSHKSRSVREDCRISRSLVEEPTMSFTGSLSLSC